MLNAPCLAMMLMETCGMRWRLTDYPAQDSAVEKTPRTKRCGAYVIIQ